MSFVFSRRGVTATMGLALACIASAHAQTVADGSCPPVTSPLLVPYLEHPLASKRAGSLENELHLIYARLNDGVSDSADTAGYGRLIAHMGALASEYMTTYHPDRQTDYTGVVAVRVAAMSRDTAAVRRIVAARLAPKTLSRRDRAMILDLTARAVTDIDHPELLPVAENYVAQLDAMGTQSDVAPEQAKSHNALLYMYRMLGRDADAMRHAHLAFDANMRATFEDRMFKIDDMGSLETFASQPVPLTDAELAGYGTKLRDKCVVPPDIIAAWQASHEAP